MDTHANAVSVAAGYLDTARPGWSGKIDTRILDMSDGMLCVMGQLDGNTNAWGEMANEIEYETGHSMAGIFSSSQELWLEEIAARQKK